MSARNIEIHTNASGLGTIHLDGEQLTGVRGYTIHSRAGKLPTIEIDLAIHDVDYFGEASIYLPDKTIASLLALGWTPPAADDVPVSLVKLRKAALDAVHATYQHTGDATR